MEGTMRVMQGRRPCTLPRAVPLEPMANEAVELVEFDRAAQVLVPQDFYSTLWNCDANTCVAGTDGRIGKQ